MTYVPVLTAALRLAFFALSAFGLAYIVGHSVISLRFRTWLALPAAPAHVVFWCPGCPYETGPHICGERCELAHHRVHHCWSCLQTFADSEPLGCVGVPTQAETHPAPRSRVRDFLVALLECPMCFGTWTGLAIGLVMPTLLPVELPRVAAGFALATFTAATNYLLGRATKLVPAS